jgi:putative transcriptional regulator
MADDFDKVIAGLSEAVEISGGRADPRTFRAHVPAHIDVRALRAREGLSQEGFAARYGFTLAAVRQWEQERRQPEAAARVLLRVIEREPDAVRRALGAA